MRISFHLAAICLALMLCGCVKYSQEIWINGDYSARIVTDFGLAQQVSALSALGGADPLEELRQGYKRNEAKLATDKNIKSISLAESDDEDYHYFKLDASIRDITQLGESGRIMGPRRGATGGDTPEETPAIEFTREKGGKLHFHMALSRLALKPGEGGGLFGGMGQALALSMLSGRYFTLTLHAPKILSTNGELSEDKRTATWKYSLASLISGEAPPDDIEAVIEMPNVWLPYLIAAIPALAVIIAALFFAATRNRRRRNAGQVASEIIESQPVPTGTPPASVSAASIAADTPASDPGSAEPPPSHQP